MSASVQQQKIHYNSFKKRYNTDVCCVLDRDGKTLYILDQPKVPKDNDNNILNYAIIRFLSTIYSYSIASSLIFILRDLTLTANGISL